MFLSLCVCVQRMRLGAVQCGRERRGGGGVGVVAAVDCSSQ